MPPNSTVLEQEPTTGTSIFGLWRISTSVPTTAKKADALSRRIEERFQQELLTHYSFREREQGHIVIHDGDEKREMPLMQLEIRKVTQEDGPFYDIRTLTEALG